MEAFFFGPTGQQLFAMYHPPTAGDDQVLTVICPPLFIEYMRTQLALRELAIFLAARGQHVLRFDYRGTGDSFGDTADFGISDWIDDISHAVREGRDLTGCDRVRLIGIRASALFACQSATTGSDVERLVLWDPVPDGISYLDALRRMQRTIVDFHPPLSRVERRETSREYAGHSLSDRMVAELGSLEASVYASVPKSKLHVVSTSRENTFPVPDVTVDFTSFDCLWEENLTDRMFAKPVLERLSSCLMLP